MPNYDQQLSWAKQAVVEAIAAMSTDKPRITVMDLASRIDDLNKAWDELTDALLRQKRVRDLTIAELHNQLAEHQK